MSQWILDRVLAQDWLAFRVSALKNAHPGLAGDRLTRVPFLKICVSGEMEFVSTDGPEPLTPGTGVLFAPQSFVGVRFITPTEFLRITFEHDGLLIGRERVGHRIKEGTRDTPDGELEALWSPGRLEQPAAGLLEALLTNDAAAPRRATALAQALCWEIALSLLDEEREPAEPESRAKVMLRYLKAQCHHPLDRQSAAAALGVSPGYLGTIIKRETGKPFQTVLQEMRLEHARWLLAHSDLGVEQVALRTGFSSSNYFSQVFRKAHGTSPRQWREGSGGSSG
jgi:AraC-like DNA-binding protein